MEDLPLGSESLVTVGGADFRAVSMGIGGVAHRVCSYSTAFGSGPERKNMEAKLELFFLGVFGVCGVLGVVDEGACRRMSGMCRLRLIGGGAAESKEVMRVDTPAVSILQR